ncbi:hypothetical protein Hbal_2011 [Hirschia baltica ATCC 49814]|uniref:SPOR domain-containing protein n=2 Tax=Hirschia TaxID=2723 RepID=C6XL95_HIRBI|nr:hypothetical protein Hbal_2011 [Hirschia baltica ATCC 49814]
MIVKCWFSATFLNDVLTTLSEIGLMKINLLHILRVSVFSVGAIALSACTRISGSGETSYVDDGLRQDPPEGVLIPKDLRSYQPTDELAMVDEIESKVQALNVELKTLRSALEIMQPVDEAALSYSDANYSAAPEPISEAAQHTPSASTPMIDVSEAETQYDEAPEMENGQSLFRYADLGLYPTQGAASADWNRLEGELDLEELTPFYDEVGGGVRLSTGPFANAEDLTEVCVDLSRVAGACEPSDDGRTLQ